MVPAPTHADASADVGRLYQDHHRWLVELLRRRLGGDTEHAADLAQDTFERLMRAGPGPGLREPRAYLTTVATRLMANFFRRAALERSYLEALAHAPLAHQPSAEDRALVLEALASVSRVLDGLPPRTRNVFLYAQLDGLPYRDIAEMMGLTLNVVQKDMIKAIAHCHAALYE